MTGISFAVGNVAAAPGFCVVHLAATPGNVVVCRALQAQWSLATGANFAGLWILWGEFRGQFETQNFPHKLGILVATPLGQKLGRTEEGAGCRGSGPAR